MPIHGVSTRESLDPRFKSLGKLRKGGPKRSGQFGADLDHFRFTSEDPAVVQAFYQAYGEKPSELVVFMPYDQMERNFSSWRELYGQNGLVKIRCDGENWVDWLDGPRHCHGYLPCPETFLDPDNRCPDCPLKPVGRLEVIVPELWKAGYIGLVTVETHSWNDIAHLAGKLAQYEPLRGKPFTLWREMTTIGAPNEKTGKRMAVTKPLVCIELTNERLVEELEAAQRRSLAQVQALALPAGEPLPAPRLVPHQECDPGRESIGPEWLEVEEDPPPTTPTLELVDAPPQIVVNGNGHNRVVQRRSFDHKIVEAIIDAGYAENPPNAVAMLNLSTKLGPGDDVDTWLTWARNYREARAELTPEDAAAMADSKVELPEQAVPA